ncbi:DUF1446 domain-containing protein [Psychromarinibacter sp. C21-152]|uniref:DUF1446 domain-containing protein n=1 Tax=Psychromarinibacter sediminicola TaxID=3033385 RepID=A0AAE3NW12_9RHOB|nr:acyclic terpene utilization AtuA family protein [Psychromarinibacter sediminicola]MDF0603061.1 DUF1446 domain-containing protein [Psychromarinibacter sediminicola]
MRDSTHIIGSGAGFSGDRIDAAQAVVAEIAARGQGGTLMFEVLGERTLALGHVARVRDPEAGYDPLLRDYMAPILAPALAGGVRIVGNFGAANPDAAARLIAGLCAEQGLAAQIAVVHGDDLTAEMRDGGADRWDGDGTLADPPGDPIAVNVYLGARPIAEALTAGADIVVTGRVADPALALGPLAAHFGWDWDDLDLVAAGTLVGHLLECGSQVSGGYFADPGVKDVADMARIGFPLAEVRADGGFELFKPRGTGGRIDRRTVIEQLLYEIHDPAAYLTPDVTLDLTGVTVEETGPDRVALSGARGQARPEKLKATVSYPGEWIGEAEISYAGGNARGRAELAIAVMRDRLAIRGVAPRMRADIFGTVSSFDSDDGALRRAADWPEAGDYRVRFAFGGSEAAVQAATQEVNALYCCGPAGGGGVRTSVRARFVTRSRMIDRASVTPRVEFLADREAAE